MNSVFVANEFFITILSVGTVFESKCEELKL